MLIGDIKMNAKYKVTFYVDFKEEKEEGIAFGENPGDIVNNIFKYYGKDEVEEVTISLFEDYDCSVLPKTIIEDYFSSPHNDV